LVTSDRRVAAPAGGGDPVGHSHQIGVFRDQGVGRYIRQLHSLFAHNLVQRGQLDWIHASPIGLAHAIRDRSESLSRRRLRNRCPGSNRSAQAAPLSRRVELFNPSNVRAPLLPITL
jgi:hypothetical protein